MALYTPRKVVLNWYQFDISFSHELIKNFIDGIEIQVEESMSRYEKEKETLVFEEVPEENYARVVEVHRELDDETWDLKGIFLEYFPSLQRQSALVTLFSYFEHELDKLCLLYQSEKSYKLSYLDLSGRGIERSINYLEKVAKITVHKASKEWCHIKNIQKIRNIIAHQNGKIIDNKGEPIKAVKEYINQIESLDGDEEVIINKGFLSHVANVYDAYFKLLGESISDKEMAKS